MILQDLSLWIGGYSLCQCGLIINNSVLDKGNVNENSTGFRTFAPQN